MPKTPEAEYEWASLKATLDNQQALVLTFPDLEAYTHYRYRQANRIRRAWPHGGYSLHVQVTAREGLAYTCVAWIESTEVRNNE